MTASIKDCLTQGVSQLTQLDSPVQESLYLLQFTLQKSKEWLLAHEEVRLEAQQVNAFQEALKRRAQGEPLAYITGKASFWTGTFHVTSDTLIPRPETELILEWVFAQYPGAEICSCLELGTGSGALVLSLAELKPHWHFTALDCSSAALQIAQYNAQQRGQYIQWRRSDWFSHISETFDLIISNPPYLANTDVHLLALQYEPQSALVAGPQGLECLHTIITQSPAHLNTGGRLCLEHGATQGAGVRQLLQDTGFCEIQTHHDLAGLERFTCALWL